MVYEPSATNRPIELTRKEVLTRLWACEFLVVSSRLAYYLGFFRDNFMVVYFSKSSKSN